MGFGVVVAAEFCFTSIAESEISERERERERREKRRGERREGEERERRRRRRERQKRREGERRRCKGWQRPLQRTLPAFATWSRSRLQNPNMGAKEP